MTSLVTIFLPEVPCLDEFRRIRGIDIDPENLKKKFIKTF